MTRACLRAGVLAFALAACGAPAEYTRDGGAKTGAFTTFAARAVEWNPGKADVGRVVAIADAGDDVVLFGDEAATLFSSGARVASVAGSARGWTCGAAIPAADGRGTWLVGVDTAGKLYRMRARGAVEPVGDRYGLGSERVRAVATLGGASVAFLLESGVAVADGHEVARIGDPEIARARAMAGGGGKIALLEADAVAKIDAKTHEARGFPLEGAKSVALDGRGRLYAATDGALYAEGDDGALALLYASEARTIQGLAAAGVGSEAVVWMADGGDLGVVTGRKIAFTRAGMGAAKDLVLAGSPTGDVWVWEPRASPLPALAGAPRRFGQGEPADGWTRDVRPVFARACAACHLPGGAAGVDLSTRAAWMAEKDEIARRVLSEKSMPPDGHPLGDADRATLRAWLGAPK
jgi:mono/diheme cytochrome c family protein